MKISYDNTEDKMKYKRITPQISHKAIILDGAKIIGDVTLKKGVSVWFNAVIRGDMAEVVILENTNIQDNAVIHTNTNIPTFIGKNVTIGHSAIIHAATIKDNALIGMGAIILDNVEVGEHAMVAAGTVVPPGKKIPAKMLALGNPMKIIRQLRSEEIDANILNSKKYVLLAKEYKV